MNLADYVIKFYEAEYGFSEDHVHVPTKLLLPGEPFSSPEPYTQVSLSDQDLSIVVVGIVGVAVFVNILHFHILLQNYLVDFKQYWSKLGEGD